MKSNKFIRVPVLFIISNLPSKGYPEHIFKLRKIESLEENGVVPIIFNVNAMDSKINYLKAIPKIHSIIHKQKPALIHSMGIYANILAILNSGLPIVAEFLSEFEIIGFKKFNPGNVKQIIHQKKVANFIFRYNHILATLIFSRANKILVKSNRMKNLVPHKYINKTEIIPNGVDITMFRPMGREKCRTRLNFYPNEKVILFLGRKSNPVKKFELAFRAIEELKKLLPQEKIRLISLDKIEPEMVPVYLNAVDVGLLTSITEGSPNVIKESLACGLPIVSTDVGDVRNIFNGIEQARILEEPAINLIADGLYQILTMNKRIDQKEFPESLNSDNVAQQHIELYESVSADFKYKL